MRKSRDLILLFIFTCMEFNALALPPSEIYYGKNALWYIFLDLRKEIKIVEIGGIKYGYLDSLKHTGMNDTIASSKTSVLWIKNKNYYYKNKKLKLKIKLKKCNYTERMDSKRSKLFGTDVFSKISELERTFGNTSYKIDGSEIYADYIYFRDSIKTEENYQPSFLSRFYLEAKTTIKEILVYDYFAGEEYTTTSASSQLDRLEKTNTVKIKLEPAITDSLSHIMKKARTTSLLLPQSKTGKRLLFAEVITSENKVLKIYISKNVICDYTNKQEYWIKNPEHLKWVSEFIDKMYSTKNSISEQHL